MSEKTVLPAADATVQEFDWGELVWYANRKLGNSATMTFGRAVLKGRARKLPPFSSQL